jgi:hypothetical protein
MLPLVLQKARTPAKGANEPGIGAFTWRGFVLFGVQLVRGPAFFSPTA